MFCQADATHVARKAMTQETAAPPPVLMAARAAARLFVSAQSGVPIVERILKARLLSDLFQL
jgi:hypothetical protein